MSPKLSIIIPIYNTGSYLPRCLDSILSQSYMDFELLLVDDGSTDNSGALCEAYAQKDTRIKVFHRENGGICAARNTGLDHAQGEWIYLVDSDDELIPEGLRTLIDCISDDVDVVMGGYEQYDLDGNLIEREKKHATLTFSRRDSLLVLFPEHSIHYSYLGYVWIRLFRNRIIQDHALRFDTGIRIKEDALFVTQYLCKSNGKTRFTTTPVYKYKAQKNSEMNSLLSAYNPKYVYSFDAVVKMYSAIRQLPELDRQLSKAAKHEIVRRVYLINDHMLLHHVVDKKCLSKLKRRAIKEVGLTYYLEYQYDRDKRRAKKQLKRLFKTT